MTMLLFVIAETIREGITQRLDSIVGIFLLLLFRGRTICLLFFKLCLPFTAFLDTCLLGPGVFYRLVPFLCHCRQLCLLFLLGGIAAPLARFLESLINRRIKFGRITQNVS